MKAKLQKIVETLSQLVSDVETVKDEAQEKFDEKTEQWQESEKGQDAQAQIDGLAEVSDSIESAKDQLDDILSSMK